MRYQVFDGGKPADCNYHNTHDSWDNSVFNTFEEAQVYARKWLGPHYGGSEDGLDGYCLRVNTPWDYSDFGDLIEIRTVE